MSEGLNLFTSVAEGPHDPFHLSSLYGCFSQDHSCNQFIDDKIIYQLMADVGYFVIAGILGANGPKQSKRKKKDGIKTPL